MSTTQTSLPTQYLVTFDRIGRTHNPPPLLVQTDDLDTLAGKIDEYADTMLTSHGNETCVEGNGRVTVFAGSRTGGAGHYCKVATLCRDETCPTCGHFETASVVPMVEGGVVPELLAIHCRRCGGFFVEADTEAKTHLADLEAQYREGVATR